jgi:hypothetical protein
MHICDVVDYLFTGKEKKTDGSKYIYDITSTNTHIDRTKELISFIYLIMS